MKEEEKNSLSQNKKKNVKTVFLNEFVFFSVLILINELNNPKHVTLAQLLVDTIFAPIEPQMREFGPINCRI